jgi:hypothetical protein
MPDIDVKPALDWLKAKGGLAAGVAISIFLGVVAVLEFTPVGLYVEQSNTLMARRIAAGDAPDEPSTPTVPEGYVPATWASIWPEAEVWRAYAVAVGMDLDAIKTHENNMESWANYTNKPAYATDRYIAAVTEVLKGMGVAVGPGGAPLP